MSTLIAKKQTELIVFGYMRDAESLLNVMYNSYYIIPTPIIYVALSYIQNYFANDESHIWRITDPKMVHQMLNAQNGEKFESEIFDMVRLKWRLEIYPNGNNKELEGYFIIHLRLISVPSNIDRIIINRIFRVIENMSSSTWMSELSGDEYEYWGVKCPLLELIEINVQTISIETQVIIHRILLHEKDESLLENDLMIKEENYPLHTHIIYKLYGDELKAFKRSKNGKELLLGDIVDSMWWLSVCPSGKNQRYNGNVAMYVMLCRLPQNVEKLHIRLKIQCIETSAISMGSAYLSLQNISSGCHRLFKLESVMNLDQLTFIVDIDILNIAPKTDNNLIEICDPIKITELLLSTYKTSDGNWKCIICGLINKSHRRQCQACFSILPSI